MTKKVWALAICLVAFGVTGSASAQSADRTYFYCYAYAQDGRVYVADSVRQGSASDYSAPLQAFLSRVQSVTGIGSFSANGCRPAYASPDQNAVENERLNFIAQERSNGKSVATVRW